jgi:hypothetical protein
MNYREANTRLQGRCYSSRKLENNTYLRRRDWGSTKAIAVQLHSTDVITFYEDGRIEVNTGGWDTVTTRDRINSYLDKPWHVYGERGATILSNYRWYAGQDDEYKRTGSAEVVLGNSATILPDGTVDGGDSAQEYRDRIRQQDNERQRLRSRLRYWVQRARTKTPCKLTVADIANEENSQIRSAKIAAYGLERYFVEAGADTLQTDGEYTLLRIKLDQWNSMTVLKMVCPSTQAAYVCPVEPRTQTIDEALDFMFGVENYREQLVAES